MKDNFINVQKNLLNCKTKLYPICIQKRGMCVRVVFADNETIQNEISIAELDKDL